MPTDTTAFSSLNDVSAALTFLDDNTKVIHSQNFCLAYTGEPVWHINGKELPPRTPETFKQITQLYIHNQTEFLSRLQGHFALQLIDLKTNNSLAASDRIGVHRLYWCKKHE